MQFYKLEATGNDFIIFLSINDNLNIKQLCDRHYGIGADGIILMDDNNNVKIYNSDGSSAKMCGNGLRCLGYLISYLSNINNMIVQLEEKSIELNKCDDDTITIKMPHPLMIKKDDGYYVTLLNNHYVLIVNDINNYSFDEKLINYSKINKCNIHIISIGNRKNIKMKSYEYGVGKTKSCGSGSLACFFALYMLDKVDNSVNVYQQGGIVKCFYKNNEYFINGKVNLIYKGEIISGI